MNKNNEQAKSPKKRNKAASQHPHEKHNVPHFENQQTIKGQPSKGKEKQEMNISLSKMIGGVRLNNMAKFGATQLNVIPHHLI
mmetsp:Transcript_27752/g.37067  ORF Transcript_27752/g.37067 Transcript_27752/m.37067 type:complete len:83 (-) Transcript_27752:68-316(-)